jgi:hypothetical protein
MIAAMDKGSGFEYWADAPGLVGRDGPSRLPVEERPLCQRGRDPSITERVGRVGCRRKGAPGRSAAYGGVATS